MLYATLVTRLAEFAELREEWFELICRSSQSTIFDTFEWQYNWWQTVGSKNVFAKLLIAVLRDQSGVLTGIIPCFTRPWLTWPRGQLCFLGAGYSDYHDVIAADGFEDEVCAQFVRCLNELMTWQVADINQLREGGLIRTFLTPEKLAGLKCVELIQEECPSLELPSGRTADERWERLLASYSKKMRGNIRYYDRSLDRIYDVRRILAKTAEEVSDALEALFQLHQRRWNQKWLPGVFYSRRARSFHRITATELCCRGWLRLHSISLDGSIEASLYCFSINGVTSYYQGGFEPSLARLSLGSVLIGHAIRQGLEEGNKTFDFLRGDEPYKRRWTDGHSKWNRRWVVARRGFPLFPLVAAWAGFQLKIELEFKKWMHHRKNERRENVVEKDRN